jgi:hypothetical protein
MDHRIVSTVVFAGALCAPALTHAADDEPASTDAFAETESASTEDAEIEDAETDDTEIDDAGAADGWDATEASEPPPPRVAIEPTSAATENPTPVDLEAKRRRSRARGLMIGGWTTFGATYAASLTAGVVGIDIADGDERQRKWGRRMTIPIGGPIAAAFVTESATGTLFTVLTSAAQTAGLVMGIAGTVMVVRQKKQPRLSFGIAPSGDGMRMGATLRF